MDLLTDEIRAWIGRKVTYQAPDEIGRASIRYFATALGDNNPLHRNDDYARAAGYAGVIAPPTFICETCQYVDGTPDEDGYVGHNWDLPLSGCRMLRVGNDYEFHQAALADTVLAVTWTLESIDERSYSKGGTQLFVVSVARYYDQHGNALATNRETTVYQPLT
ncbi:MAG: MaoC family dehydratase N-terminal domain-containing protein [Gammaproteobacteria bacterium]